MSDNKVLKPFTFQVMVQAVGLDDAIGLLEIAHFDVDNLDEVKRVD